MREYYPLLLVGGLIGLISVILIVAFATMKNKKEAIGFERNMKDRDIIVRMLKYAKPYKKQFAFSVFLMLVSIAYDIASPIIIGNIEETMKGDFRLMSLWLNVGLYASILIVSMACTYVQAIILQKTGQAIVSGIRQDLFTVIEGLSHEQLNRIPVGVLVTRETNDTNAISMMFTSLLVSLCKNIFMIVGVVAAMLKINLELTLMVLCFAPFIVLFTLIFRKFARRAFRRVKDNNTDINIYLSENLSGIKITQIFNREKRKMDDFVMRSKRLGQSKMQQILVFSLFRPTVYMLYISSVLCLLYLGGKGYIQDTSFFGQVITSGTVVTFYMYLKNFFTPIQNIAEQFNRLQAAFASAEKVFYIMDIKPIVVDEPDAVELEHVNGEIEFKNVWFAYKENEWVLKDVSFKVEAMQTVAFVGATGSGKSTILSLICRNYDIQKGQILIDGIDIKHIKLSSLRKQFGQMLQDVFLFSGTIRSNILMRMEGVSDDEIRKVCHYVNADNFIDKTENGLDEPVRERGNNFSVGERQLLSFARTIIHKPSVMILDEATANIDTETEILIQDSLEKMRSIGTMLVVAHRLSTIRHADKIFLISHGEIVEQGTHQELIELGGQYNKLYTLQYHKEQLKKQ